MTTLALSWSSAARAEPPAKANAQAFQQWREARFGMFIHWGPVSLTEKEISWSRANSNPQCPNKGPTPIEVYDNLYKRFNPTKFDPAQWVAVAKAAGMKYMILTAKHCDGFLLWDSKVDDYNIMHTPLRRDVCGELAKAAQDSGMPIGWYFSPMDWRDPDFRTDRNAAFVARMQGEIRELLTNYGPIHVLWFDWDGRKPMYDQPATYALVRKLQPKVVLTNRLDLGEGNNDRQILSPQADYYTPEQSVGAYDDERPWESCMTISRRGQWSWGGPADGVKTYAECMNMLIRCAGGDGNLLLNVGPTPTGEIAPEQVDRLKEMGVWLAKYGESIYGTRGGPFKPGTFGVSTRKGQTIYLHIQRWPGETLSLPAIPAKVVRSVALTGGTATVRQTSDMLEVMVPPGDRHELDTIVALELDRPAGAIAAVAPLTASQSERRESVYRGWKTVRLSNGLIDLQVLPDIGGRIIQFKLGDKEFLWANPRLAGKLPASSGLAADGGWFNVGGDKLWPAPQGWDNDQQWPGPPGAVLDGQPYKLEPLREQLGQTAIRLTSGDDPATGIQFSRVIRIFEGDTRVSFEATMKNVDTKPRRWGIWAHTQLDGAKADGSGHNPIMQAWCPLNPQSRFPKGYSLIFGEQGHSSFQPDAARGLMRVQYQYKVGKIGLDSRAGWVATVDGNSGAVFVQRFVFELNKEYPDGASVEFWLNGVGRIRAYNREMVMPADAVENPYVFESEVLSPYARLQPGESYTWCYDWYACNIGGDFPVVNCTDAGVVAEPLVATAAEPSSREVAARWPAEKAWRWYNAQPWLVGCNFLPSTAVNDVEMWQKESFDAATIDRELGWAQQLGFNTVRVFLNFVVWREDAAGLNKRFAEFLKIADRHGISVMPILLDDCNFAGRDAATGKLHHDEDAMVYLNGELAVQAASYNAGYEPFDIATIVGL